MAFSFHNGNVYDYVKHLGHEPEPGQLQLIGIRGAVPFGEYHSQISLRSNTPNLWNDTIGLIGPEFFMFLGTVDPGLPRPGSTPNPAGMAHLLTLEEKASGGKVWHFKQGMHHNTYPCLVQNEPFTVARYNSYPPPLHPVLDRGDFGIHTHWGGTGWQVWNWSEGCMVVFGGGGPETPWESLWDKVQYYSHLQNTPGVFPFYLFQGDQFARFLGK